MSSIVRSVCRHDARGFAVLVLVALVGGFCFVGAGADELKNSVQHGIDARMALVDEMAR